MSNEKPRTPVVVEQVGSSLVLTISRQEAGNSFNVEVADEFHRQIEAVRRNKDLRALIITGEGDRFFCSGGDLKAYQALVTPADLNAAFGKARLLMDDLEGLDLLVIAAINGFSLGGGTELALACDLRIIAPGAKIGFRHPHLGLIPGWYGISRLVENVGRSTAMRLLLTVDRLKATEALELGLVDVVAQSPRDEALRIVNELDQLGPLAIGATKRAVLAAMRQTHQQSIEVTKRMFETLWFSADHREAERAFSEKRAPKFTGT